MDTVPSDLELGEAAAALGRLLLSKDLKLATAESCTGGWIAKLITDSAGSSQWFECGFVTYSNQAKMELLSVPEPHFEQFGAVSAEVVEAMALGALINSDAEVAVSVSGIAGPDGGSPDKPVGTVWFGFAGPGGCDAVKHHFEGDRDQIRRQAVALALRGLTAMLDMY